MTNVTKISAILALGLGLGTAAFAQDANLEPGEVTGVTCDDFFMADAAAQEELTTALGVTDSPEMEISAETSAKLYETIDPNIQAVGMACEGNEAELLTDLEIGM